MARAGSADHDDLAEETIPPVAAWLGGLALLPFAAGALAAVLPDRLPTLVSPDEALRAALLYAAVVLSFLGGVRWAEAMRLVGRARDTGLVAAIAPALVGWVLAALPAAPALAGFAAAFAALGAWDVIDANRGFLPAWYGRLRTILTLAVLALLLVTLAAVVLGGR